MGSNPTWANLAVIDSSQKSGISITTVFVSFDEITFSGAWFFKDIEDSELINVIQNRLVVSTSSSMQIDLNPAGSKQVFIQDFISDARNRAMESKKIFDSYVAQNIEDYKAYMAIPPAERNQLPKVMKKKLEPMYLNNWDFEVNLENPDEVLKKLGKRVDINGTSIEMKVVNKAARLIKHLMEMWKQDELERFARQNMDESFLEFKILPDAWLSILEIKAKA